MKNLLILLVLIAFASSESLVLPETVTDFTELLLHQEYDSASNYIQSTELNRDDSLFLEILLYSAKLADYESYAIHGREFLILCDSARVQFRREEEVFRSTLLVYYLGTMEGAVAVTRGKRNDFAGALTASNISKHNMELVLERDPSFTSALFGIGMRDYYSASIYNKIGLAKKRLRRSIEDIARSSEGDTPTAFSQLPSLFWIYYDQEMYSEARAVSNRFLSEYPDNSLMLRASIKLYLAEELYTEAQESAEQLLSYSSEREPTNWSDYFSAGRAIVSVMIANGNNQEAIDEIDKLMAISLDDETLKLEWVKKHRAWLQEERGKIVSLL